MIADGVADPGAGTGLRGIDRAGDCRAADADDLGGLVKCVGALVVHVPGCGCLRWCHHGRPSALASSSPCGGEPGRRALSDQVTLDYVDTRGCASPRRVIAGIAAPPRLPVRATPTAARRSRGVRGVRERRRSRPGARRCPGGRREARARAIPATPPRSRLTDTARSIERTRHSWRCSILRGVGRFDQSMRCELVAAAPSLKEQVGIQVQASRGLDLDAAHRHAGPRSNEELRRGRSVDRCAHRPCRCPGAMPPRPPTRTRAAAVGRGRRGASRGGQLSRPTAADDSAGPDDRTIEGRGSPYGGPGPRLTQDEIAAPRFPRNGSGRPASNAGVRRRSGPCSTLRSVVCASGGGRARQRTVRRSAHGLRRQRPFVRSGRSSGAAWARSTTSLTWPPSRPINRG